MKGLVKSKDKGKPTTNKVLLEACKINREPTPGAKITKKVVRIPCYGRGATIKLLDLKKLARSHRIVKQWAVKNPDKSTTWTIWYEE